MVTIVRPVSDGVRIAGPAVTAFCWPGDNLMMHRALYLAEAGDVLVVVCDSGSGAQWGDLAATYAKQKGLAGVVVHGAVRDVDQLRRLGSAVWATAISPIHPDKQGHGSVNAPVVCDGVLVKPFDQRFLCHQDDLPVSPKLTERLTIDGQTWEVVGIEQDPTRAIWMLQIRGAR